MQRADEYMRGTMNPNGPGRRPLAKVARTLLACRRNYHILFTDGGWNQNYVATSPVNYDGTSQTYDGIYSPTCRYPRVQGYGSDDNDRGLGLSEAGRLSLQNPTDPLFGGTTVQPSNKYTSAPASETFTNRVTNTTATIPKY